MPTHLTALCYVLASIAVAFVIGRVCFPNDRPALFAVVKGWVAITILLFLATSPAVFMVGSAVILLFLTPREPTPRIMFYCALLPAVPPGIDWVISTAGIPRVYSFEFSDILALSVLAPILVKASEPRRTQLAEADPIKKLKVVAIAYVVALIALDFRETSITNGMRLGLDHVLSYGILIGALARASKRVDIADAALLGVLSSGLFNLIIGLVQDFSQWLLYSEVSSALRSYPLRYDLMMSERGAGLRIPGTLTPIPYGIHMVLCAMICGLFLNQRRATRWVLPLALAFLFAAYRSDSRGAILCLIAASFIYVLWSPAFAKWRSTLLVAIVAAIVVGSLSGLTSRLLAADEYGTFAYRIDLIINSMDSISKHPVLGTPLYLANAVLQKSRQGEGLIDIVNAYLAVLLRYGLLGLLLFLLPVIWTTSALLRHRREPLDATREITSRYLLAMLLGFAFAIATVSLVDHLSRLYWILAFAFYAYAKLAGQDEKNTQRA